MKVIVRKMLVGFFAVCILLASVTYFTYLNMGNLVNRVNQDDFSLSILKNIENIQLNTLDIETGMRGFVIVGDKSFLTGYQKAKAEIHHNLDTLLQITQKYNEHLNDAKELKNYCTLLLTSSEELVNFEIKKNTDSVKRTQLLYQSKRYMDGIRSIINHIETEERLLLRKTAAENVDKAQLTKYGFLTTAGLIVIILIIVFFIVRNGILVRIRVEKELQHSSKKIFDLYNNAPCGYHSIGEGNFYIEINDVELKWLGYTREEVIGKLTIFDVLAPEDHYKINNFRALLFQGKATNLKDLEVSYVRKDGSRFEAMINSTITFDKTGQSFSSRTVVLDITDIKQSQQKINQLYVELEKNNKQLIIANEELESFSYSVSHDLRAPLRAIDGYCKILMEDHEAVLDEEGKRVLSVIMNNSHRMGVLIDDLLNFSRLGRKEMHLVEVDSKQMVEEALADLNVDNNISIKIETLVNCHADRNLLSHVWQNVLSNAIKYTSKVLKPSIRVYSYRDNEMLVYCVEDNGVGFDEQYKHKLFQVFQRLHHNNEYEGTGVGLAIVEKIISKHNGYVWAESIPNERTTFYFSIPVLSEINL